MAFGRPNPKDDARAQRAGEWLQKQNGYAVASLVLGIFSFIEFGAIVILSLAAIVLGFVGWQQLKRPDGERTQGRGLAIAGMILGTLSLAVGLTLYSMRPGG